MSAATPFPRTGRSAEENTTTFRAVLEHAPIAFARCDRQGLIVEMNPAFERGLNRDPDRNLANRRSLRFAELVRPEDREKTQSVLRELFSSGCDSIKIESRGVGQFSGKWTAWRQTGFSEETDYALLMAEQLSSPPQEDHIHAEESQIQTRRWEAIGRLTGGVVHDFNNLLTGVMLYCDLLLTSLDALDRRRRYADDIRSAIIQAATLVRQLLVFARPQQASPPSLLSLNRIAQSMQGLLARLLGEHISLDLRLDPELGAIKIDQAQAQQILLNLVLNARDALPHGGTITVETSNCRFQPVAGAVMQGSVPAFPCVLLVVGDDGQGMTLEVQRRLFEPFFTTKNSGEGTGLGLTTVRSIVTTNRGLIHFESEPGRGTRVMILLPQASHSAANSLPDPDLPDSRNSDSYVPSVSPFQEIKKESLI